MKKKRKNTHDAEADVEIKRSGAERLAGAGGTASRWDFKENEDQDDDDGDDDDDDDEDDHGDATHAGSSPQTGPEDLISGYCSHLPEDNNDDDDD